MPRNTTITPMCMATLRIIVEYHVKHKYSPSFRDVAQKLDELRSEESDALTSTNTVSYHIKKLIAFGYLDGDPKLARAYAPTELGRQMAENMIEVGHVYLCRNCNNAWIWSKVKKHEYFLICPQDGNVVIDITQSSRAVRLLEGLRKIANGEWKTIHEQNKIEQES